MGTHLSGSTKVVCVWGHPIAHSKSPAMQNAAIRELGLDWIYAPFDVSPENIADAVAGLRAMNFVGANCTVPLKEIVGSHLDHVAPDASRIGSVNTIVNRDGVLTGHSTDGQGFIWNLERQGIIPDGQRVLIWGAGGSARAIAYALAQRGCSITIANRTIERAVAVAGLIDGTAIGLTSKAYEEALAAAQLLVNTTTLGMNDNAIPPLPPNLPHAGQTVYDIIYSSTTTPLIARAQAHGCRALNGLGLLACQGALSLSLWTGLPAEQMPLAAMLGAIM